MYNGGQYWQGEEAVVPEEGPICHHPVTQSHSQTNYPVYMIPLLIYFLDYTTFKDFRYTKSHHMPERSVLSIYIVVSIYK